MDISSTHRTQSLASSFKFLNLSFIELNKTLFNPVPISIFCVILRNVLGVGRAKITC